MSRTLSQFIQTLFMGVLLVAFTLPVVSAQYNGNINRGNYNPNDPRNQINNLGQYDPTYDPAAEFYDEEEDGHRNKKDTTERKPRKPLESYFFDDSTRKRPNFAWNVDTYRNRIRFAEIDTALYDSQIIYPFYRRGVGDANQGNLGGASVPLNYFDRPQYSNFEFASAFYSYFFTPENTRFFNVKKPFSQMDYYWGGQKKYAEENFGITHAQNISPSSGFNVDYHSRGKRGIYASQKARAKNLSIAFSHTGKKYSVHAGYIYNAILNRENGGILDDRHIIDTILELPENIPVGLSDARNTTKNNSYYVVQSYGVPLRRLTDDDFSIADRSSVFVGHSLTYNRWSRVYTDTYQGSNYNYFDLDGNQINGNYYGNNWFIDPVETRDSIFESLLSNRVFVQLQPWVRDGVVGTIDGGIGMDLHRFYQFSPGQYLSGSSTARKETSYYIYGSVTGKVKRYFNWEGDAMLHPTGYRSGDLKVGGNISGSIYIKDKPLTLSAKIYHERRSPGYWTQNYYSNHYIWSNSFDKENETRMVATLTMPSIGLEVGAWQSLVSNKVYYDEYCLPRQSGDDITVSGLYAKKDFRAGGFHFNHRVLLQWSSSSDVIPVPSLSAFLAYYYEFNVVKNVLRMQLGVDCRYNTRYYAFGYNPATSVFYNQREKKLGEYPMLNAYLSAKWKRMRILLTMQHFNEDLFGERNYFDLLHYPQGKSLLKLGISWTFYD